MLGKIAKSTTRRRMLSPRGIAWIASGPMLLGLVVFAVYPFFYLIGLAFTDSSLARVFQEWTGFANFSDALNDQRIVVARILDVKSPDLTFLVNAVLRESGKSGDESEKCDKQRAHALSPHLAHRQKAHRQCRYRPRRPCPPCRSPFRASGRGSPWPSGGGLRRFRSGVRDRAGRYTSSPWC